MMNYEKLVIFPKVIVYKKILENVSDIFETVKHTESYTEKKHMFSPWKEWNANWSGMSTQIDGARDLVINSNDSDAVMQNKFFKNIYNVFDFVVKDFFSDYKEDKDWPTYLDLSNNQRLSQAGISLLKYGEPQDHQTLHDLAMNYHTDTNSFDIDSPGYKLAITVTMYLNDDYEGGEISFYDEKENRVYNYKPKAGDVTVFPSSSPYFHGVLPFNGSFRYLLRMFITYKVDASENWNNGLKLHGSKKWEDMEKKRLTQDYEDGKNIIYLKYNENDPDHPKFKTIYLDKDPVWVS